jgi:hypothetical protein
MGSNEHRGSVSSGMNLRNSGNRLGLPSGLLNKHLWGALPVPWPPCASKGALNEATSPVLSVEPTSVWPFHFGSGRIPIPKQSDVNLLSSTRTPYASQSQPRAAKFWLC